MSGKHDRAAELRAIADGRLLLNVRNGVTVSRSMLAMIADEIDAERAAHAETKRERDEALKALDEIRDLKERPYEEFPADWREQIAACPECKRYADHPIQRGICNEHRRPLYAREDHDKHETKILGYRAKGIARDALDRRVREGGRDA